MNQNEPKCGIVILNYNSHDLTIALANKVAKFESISNICVVDNCSKDNFDGEFSHPKIHYIKNDRNSGYSAGNNVGLKYLIDEKKCDFVWIANPDVLFEDSTIRKMYECFQANPELALLSTKRFGPNKTLIHQYFDFPTFKTSVQNCFFLTRRKFEHNRHIEQNSVIDKAEGVHYVDAVPGAFFGIRSDFLIKNNFIFEGIFLYGEEIILGRQAHNMGYKVGVINTDEYVHDHHQKRFSNRKMFWLDRKSLKIYFKMFEKFNYFQWMILNTAFVLGTIEYNCAYVLYNLLKRK